MMDMKKRKIPNYNDKVLTKEEKKKLKKLQTDIAAGRIKKIKGRIKKDDE